MRIALHGAVISAMLCGVPALVGQSAADQQTNPDAASAGLRPLKQSAPTYPPIAKAAHVSGEVRLQVEIAPDGHVLSAKSLSGPAMLISSAVECVKKWLFEPAAASDSSPRVTTVTIPFLLSPQINPSDQEIAAQFFPLDQACIRAVSSHAPAADEVTLCKRAAGVAEQFSTQERFIERRSIFVYTATAMIRDRQTTEALNYANKSVAVVEQGHDDGSGSSAAYSVRAQAEAQGGQLQEASQDLTKAEQFERDAIRQMEPLNTDLSHRKYLPALRGMLKFHAQILSAMGKPEEAAAKTREADAL